MDKKRDILCFDKIEVLDKNDSKYIKPHRIHYKVNGKPLVWDCMKVHDSVSIVLFNKSSKKLVFVRQFRPAVAFAMLCQSIDTLDSNQFTDDKIQEINQMFAENKNFGYTLELCAGIVDKSGKTTKEIAKEEIEEETGYKVDLESLQLISSFRSGVGVSGSVQHMYFCEISDETPKGKGGGIEDENIEVIELTIEGSEKLIFCEDKEAMLSRPASMLLGLSWFLYKYLPNV